MNPVLLVLPGLFVGVLLCIGIIAAYWFLEINVHQPATNIDSYRHMYVTTELGAIWSDLIAFVIAVPTLLIGGFASVITGVLKNVAILFIFFILTVLAFGALQYGSPIIQNVIIVRQCVLVPFAYSLVFPLLNAARIIYNAAIMLWNYYVDLSKIGASRAIIDCALATTDVSTFFVYFCNIFLVWTEDMIAWFAIGFLDHNFDIVNTLDAIGLFLDCFVPPLTCLCQVLGFLWEALSIWVRMRSLHSAINLIFNFAIAVLQIPINTMMATPHIPKFDRAATVGCGALKETASTIEDTVYLIAQTGWGIFSGDEVLPLDIQIFLSAQWLHILADPLCGVVIFTNMTLTVVVNYDDLTDSEGIAYFQFGLIFDELKSAAGHFASIFSLWNNDAQATIDQILNLIINLIAFVFEWIPGNIYYFLFGGPLPLYPSAPFVSPANFVEYYLPDYWLKPTFDNTINNSTYVYQTALNSAFMSAFMSTQAIGNLIANLLDMDPLGGMIQHLLNMIICLIQILANMISFFFAIITFSTDPRTTMKQVVFDNFFNEMYFFATSAGDFWRQFATPDPLTNFTCQITVNEDENSVWCCTGNLVERLIDVVAVTLQQIVHFLQDLATLPTGNVMFCIIFIPYNATNANQCVRIPDLSTALFLLDQSLCYFTCAVFSVIPLLSEFQCSFPLPVPPSDPNIPPQAPKPCGHVSTCTSNLACSILRFFLVPLIITNTYFSMVMQGISYSSYTDAASVTTQIFFNVLAKAVEAFGLLINCTLCAFTSTGTNCADDIYQIFLALAELVRFLPLIFTRTFFILVKLGLTFVMGFFTGDPVGAVIQVAVGILRDVLGGLGAAVVNFLVRFFDGIGLGFIGTFIKVLWNGFCPLLQAILNTVILGLKAITFGLVQINFVDFCCDGSPTCTPSSRKRDQLGNIIDGVLHVDLENWVSQTVAHFRWEEGTPCNTSMAYYGEQTWSNLTEWQQSEVLLCLIKPYWLMRDDDQTPIGNSTCDVLMIEYNRTNWTDIDVLTRRTMIDCLWSRLITDGLRLSTGSSWIPSDILTNPYRKYVFATELTRGFLIYWQYKKDMTATSEVLFSDQYKGTWTNYGLNTTHYQEMTTVDEILWFRSRYTLKDYFIWNGNAAQYEPVNAVMSGAGSFFQEFLNSISNTTTAFSDTQLDPTIYLQYSYTMDDAAAGITSSAYFLLNDVLNGSKTIYNYWTSPATIKKRNNGYALLKNGTWGMYRAGINQLTKMGAEYWQDKRAVADKYWSGHCLPGECQEFVSQYNQSMHEDEHSLVYRLSHWYQKNKDTLFKAYPIKRGPIAQEATHERYDKMFHWYTRRNHSDTYKIMLTQSTREDKHPVWIVQKKVNGEHHEIYATVKPRESDRERIYNQSASSRGRERFWRVYELFAKGSHGSRRRWEGMSKIWTTFKERMYHNVLKNNMEFATDFIEKVYRNPSHQTRREKQQEEREIEATNSYREWERRASERARIRDLENGARQTGSKLVLRNRDYSQFALYDQICDSGGKEYNNNGICQIRSAAKKNPTSAPPPPLGPTSDNVVDYLTPIMIHGQGANYFRDKQLYPLGLHPKGVILAPKSGIRKLGQSELFQQAVVSIDALFNLTCYTNITFLNSTLCDECFILDQIVGRIEAGLEWLLEWYTAPAFVANLEMAQDFFTYAFDDNAPVVVGDSPQLQVGEFPGFDTNNGWYNVRYLGDNVPNKTRFSDVFGMIQNATNATNSTPIMTGNGFWINDTIAVIVNSLFGWLWDFVQTLFEYFSGGGGTMGVTQGFDFYVDWFYTCDWMTGRDVRSLDIRFSFGEGVLMYFVTFTSISVILMATVEWSILNIFLTSTGLLILASSFGSIVYNFAYKCIPALPGALADSVFYFLAYTILPKCSWFWGFMIANEEYDNEHCFACEQADQWQIVECVADLGFGDIIANIVFMIQFYAPEWLQWIRDSRILPIAILYHIPQVNERLNEFTDIDMSNRKTYAHYMGCNYIMTLIPNLIIAIVFLYILFLLSPLASAVLTIAWLFVLLIYSLLRLSNLMWEDIFITQTVAPFIVSGIVDGPLVEQSLSDFTIPGRVSQSMSSKPSMTTLGYGGGDRERSGFSFTRLKNAMMRGWDNLFITDRKTK